MELRGEAVPALFFQSCVCFTKIETPCDVPGSVFGLDLQYFSFLKKQRKFYLVNLKDSRKPPSKMALLKSGMAVTSMSTKKLRVITEKGPFENLTRNCVYYQGIISTVPPGIKKAYPRYTYMLRAETPYDLLNTQDIM